MKIKINIRLLGNGKKFGVRIEYFIQEKPRGIPEALICNDFIKASKVMLVLVIIFFIAMD